MFFSPDLLSKRDNGFGLLWLAATLGSKSAFKKLPKRSVMTADISQLCRLIATPAEPLALRLSSNLLVGAARVYRVKQEIFMSDVTTCFNTLKRVEYEFRSIASSSEAQLQMTQPTVKSSVVTLRADPRAAFSLEFDAMVTNWDEYLSTGGNSNDVEGDSDEYHPVTKANRKAATSSTLPTKSELLRATACTLPDNHDFFIANSFDASFGGSGSIKLSSSQIRGFGFDDTFDGLDIEEGIGDDLVRELGEGWGASFIEENTAEVFAPAQGPVGMNFDDGDLDDMMVGLDGLVQVEQSPQLNMLTSSTQDSHIELEEFFPPHSLACTPKSVVLENFVHTSRSPPPTELATLAGPTQPEENGAMLRKAKRARPILDVRTELTDEELKATRVYYLDMQNAIRCELEIKRFEKQQVDLIHTLLWDAPNGVHAQELIDFWVEHFKIHVNARSSFFVEPQRLGNKRRKVVVSPPKPYTKDIIDNPVLVTDNWAARQEAMVPMNGGDEIDFNYNIDVNWGDINDDINDYIPSAKNPRSSEEPGQARRASHPPSATGNNLGVEVVSDNVHSQRSALFPWDMAGSSSSVSVHEGGIQHDRISIEHADARLRGSSASQRGSSLHSVPGNLQTSMGSPAVNLAAIQSDDDFVFDVPGDIHAFESRQSEANPMTLEKNTYNFLESVYAKMQYMSLPNAQFLLFDDVVPKTTSTARVAAAAMYHCLVLATKDLLRVKQEEPYGRIAIRII